MKSFVVIKFPAYDKLSILIILYEENYEIVNKCLEQIDDFKIIIIELHDWMIPNKSISSSFINSLSLTLKKNSRDLIIQGENLISIKINKWKF